MVPLDKKSEQEGSGKHHVEERLLILHNDEINTFDHVMHTLQEICLHDKVQAEQCAILTHLKGHCEIKRGVLTQLEELQEQLTSKALNVTID
jgi:ATP-dependent Clp protease adaptor protein ClpS